MRITGKLILMAATALCVASCAKDTEKLLGGDGVSLQVTAVMDDGTKAGLDDTNFIENDQIGLFMTGYDGKYCNVKATGTGSGTGTAVTQWTLGQDVSLTKESAVVAAYYPYNEKTDWHYDPDKDDFYIDIHVADQLNYLRGYAKEVNESNPKANITFHHAMARLRLQVSYFDGKSHLTEIRFSKVVTAGGISLISGRILHQGILNGVDTTVLTISNTEEMPLASEGIYDVLLLPQAATTATLTLTFNDGKSYDTSVSLPTMSSGDYNILPITIKETSTPATDEHDYVDLGLSSGTLWATCNVGATSPEEYGNYYAWGETTTKSNYTYSNYSYSSNPTTLPADRDAARANWGGSWSMPTLTDFQELYNECTWTWTTMNGKNGYKVSSRKNSSYIFLPAAGFFDSSLYRAGSYGSYWSSSLYTSNTLDAYGLNFDSSSVFPSNDRRYGGQSVRPVLRK